MSEFFRPFGPSQAFLIPLVKASPLAVTKVEKLVTFQMRLLQSYVDLSLNCLKTAGMVHDPQALLTFYTHQFETLALPTQQVLKDLRGRSEPSIGFPVEFTALVRGSVDEGASHVTQTTKGAFRKAA